MTGTVEDRLREELRFAQRKAHEADAERADAEALLLEARAHTLRAQAMTARVHAHAVTASAVVAEVRRLCNLTIDASVRVQAVEQARDTLAVIDSITGGAPSDADAAWGSVWLHGKWSWLTQNMTTPQRELAADAVARWSAVLNADDGDLESGEPTGLRWWREVSS